MGEIKKWLVFVVLLSLMATPVMAACAEPAPTKVTLTAYFSAPEFRWDLLVATAKEKFKKENPNIDLEVNYTVYPYEEMSGRLLAMAATRTKADIIAVDQIWLGQFVETGYIKDITDEAKKWGIEKKLSAPYLEGSKYNGKYYAVWLWTDARLLWYRKDVLEKANVEVGDLKTWKGFLNAVPKIKEAAEARGMRGVAFPGAAWLVDWWYPFLFQNGGKILIQTDGGDEAGFDNDAGIEAAKFLLKMKQAGVEIRTDWKWGEDFVDGSYAAYFGGTWVLGKFSEEKLANIREQVGVTMFPAPAEKEPRTLNGGWLLSVPVTTEYPEISWEFIKCMLDPDILTPVLAEFGYLPTNKEIAEEPYASQLGQNIAFWSEFQKSLSLGGGRPNMPEYPLVAEVLYEALLKVLDQKATPEDAIHAAAEKVNALWR